MLAWCKLRSGEASFLQEQGGRAQPVAHEICGSALDRVRFVLHLLGQPTHAKMKKGRRGQGVDRDERGEWQKPNLPSPEGVLLRRNTALFSVKRLTDNSVVPSWW